ncbi:unnamed protein product [Phytophthora fragariaefolia]|uniref:Unnamed protein product n=1 Tax=Phytophthora fragariaefolia TaxID=1490495 RepID=A0A9W6YAZ2_9STRA|nr:unnamed protein product [Phytophthora fragariaefolia]
MRYCRRQGWLEFGSSTQGTLPPTAPGREATTSESAAEAPAAEKLDARKLPRPARKATQVAVATQPDQGAVTDLPAKAITESTPWLHEGVELQLPEATEAVADSPPHAITEDPRSITSATELTVTDNHAGKAPSTEEAVTAGSVDQVGARRSTTAVSLDDFDSNDFLDALKRDKLFASTEPDDLNTGNADWLLELNSDAEGDEESILLDEGDCDPDDNDASAAQESRNDDESEEDDGLDVDEVPVEFELTNEELDKLQADGWDTFDEQHAGQVLLDPIPLYEGPSGPTRAALAYAESPLAIFYFFLPKELWWMIAKVSNRYRTDSIDEVAQGMRARARARRETTPSTMVLSVEEYRTKLKRKKPIQPHELVRYIGLLIARSLEPRHESLSRHWITKVEGTLSRGTFGQFISRYRFHDIARFLHFNDNAKQADSGDRAFKMRPVIQALQKTFFRGYRMGARISFDEGMVPMRHRRNPMRQVMPMKPNKWANVNEDAVAQRAVVKNILHVLQGQPAQRLICTDNFYTSIPLSHKLLGMGYCHVGTMRNDRRGWCKAIDFTQKKRPKRMPRGTYRFSWRDHPEIVALAWMDNKPVRFLGTGCSTQLTKVTRRERDGSVSTVPCPRQVSAMKLCVVGLLSSLL